MSETKQAVNIYGVLANEELKEEVEQLKEDVAEAYLTSEADDE